MSHKRSAKSAHPAHRGGGRREKPRTPGDGPANRPPSDRPEERRIDESIEESFPASDPPAHVKDLPPVEGERRPEDDEEEPRAAEDEKKPRAADEPLRAPDDTEGGIGGRPVDLDDAIDAGEE